MKQRVIGFVLLAVAIVGGLAAFATAEDYHPQLGIVRATQRAYVWTNCTPSPPPARTSPETRLVPRILALYSCGHSERGNHFTLTLATALVVSTAVGLTGLGLAVFGRDSTQ